MASGINDLEQQLRQNLQLRRELGAQAAKATAAISARRGGGRLSGWKSFLRETFAHQPLQSAYSGELEELRRQLKLRRELVAEVTKAKDISAKQGNVIAYSSGWVLYLACLAMAGVSAFFMLRLTGEWRYDGGSLIAASISAFVFHGLGRDVRYILSGN